jgi:hypothetical protein
VGKTLSKTPIYIETIGNTLLIHTSAAKVTLVTIGHAKAGMGKITFIKICKIILTNIAESLRF